MKDFKEIVRLETPKWKVIAGQIISKGIFHTSTFYLQGYL